MKKLMVSMFALAAMASTAMAAEPLTKSQLDQVTAAGYQSNYNSTYQAAYASAYAKGGCAFYCKYSGNAAAQAVASNTNVTGQANID